VPDEPRPANPSKLEAAVFEDETPLLLRWPVIVGVSLVVVAVVGAYFIASAIWGISLEVDAEPFQEWVEDRGVFAPIVFIAVLAVSVLFAPIPNAPIFIAAGLAWGSFLGTVYSLIGCLVGSTLAFWAARWLGRRWLPRLIGRRTAERMDKIADSMGGRVVFAARMVPILNFDWLSYVAGVTSIRYSVFLLASALGMIVPTAAAVIAGDGLGRDLRLTAGALGAWLAAALLFAAWYYWRRRRYLARKRAEALVAPAPVSAPAER
jgi:uncharacterized membrane protein YdjX (TVP38/TMEM64 family)